MRPGLPIAAASDILSTVRAALSHEPNWKLGGRKRPYTASDVMCVGLLRHACGESLESIARLLDRHESAIRRMLGVHGREVAATPAYGEVAQGVIRQVLAPWRVDAPREMQIELERRIFGPHVTDEGATPIRRIAGEDGGGANVLVVVK
jgi:hypothetical protein